MTGKNIRMAKISSVRHSCQDQLWRPLELPYSDMSVDEKCARRIDLVLILILILIQISHPNLI